MLLSIEQFWATISPCWDKATSFRPEQCTAKMTASGQCLVTTLVARDYFGGKLLSGIMNEDLHYWNLLPSGLEIDFTRIQFGIVRTLAQDPYPVVNTDHLFALDSTLRDRYELLKQRFAYAVTYGQPPKTCWENMCCERDTDGDGNCDIHSSRGMFRQRVSRDLGESLNQAKLTVESLEPWQRSRDPEGERRVTED